MEQSTESPENLENRPDADPLAALFELATTSRRFAGIESLHYCNQLRRVAVRAGLRVPATPSLEELVAMRGEDPFSTADAADPFWCPVPGEHDLVPVSELREALCEALFDADGTPRREFASDGASEQLTRAALEYGLVPALTPDGVVTVLESPAKESREVNTTCDKLRDQYDRNLGGGSRANYRGPRPGRSGASGRKGLGRT